MVTRMDDRTKIIQHYSYCLLDSIGKGFSSTVYKGKNKLNGQSVAVKVIDLHKLSESTLKELLQSEINIIKSLNHANVLKCENVYTTHNNCYIITELCQSGDLASEIKRKGRLRGMEALKTMLEIARGVNHLSELNIIHRDIKPANILLHNGTVKIADFGFARYQQHQGKREKYNVGSPLYMSPEAIFSNFYSKQNDIWSLGIVFYEILQGRPPWDPKNEKQLKQILKEKKDLLFRIAIRDELQTIIRGCLIYDRAQRLTIKAILEVLEKMMEEMTKEDSNPYRETLTKRNLTTLSCKDLNTTSTFQTEGNVSTRLIVPKMLRPSLSTTNTHINKENTNKQLTPVTDQSSISKNRSTVQLKNRAQIKTLEQASRHNHCILKSIINYTRLVYKTFPRIDKIQVKQSIKLDIKAIMLGLLQYFIYWLKDSVANPKSAQEFGIVNYEKFKDTRCYSKTILVINEYYDRYMKFITKTKKNLNKVISQQKNLHHFSSKMKKIISQIKVIPAQSEHNIGLDFLISITILAEMLQNHNTVYFSQFSFIQDIVQTQPIQLLGDQEISQLNTKWEALTQLHSHQTIQYY